MRFSRFPQGDLLLMRVLIGRNLGLLAWQLCINVRCSPAVLLLYPCCYQKEGESVHFQPVLATSLWTSRMLARMRLVQEGFKPLPNRYLVTQTLDQSTWQRREQRRPQLRPQRQQKKRWRPHTSPPRVDSSNPEERFNMCLTSRKISKYRLTCCLCFLYSASPHLHS